jgi:hypothetical protein
MTQKLNMTAEQTEFLVSVIYKSELFAAGNRSGEKALDLWMKAYALGIHGMVDQDIQHYAHDFVMGLDSDDLLLEHWGIDPDNRSEAFPYYKEASFGMSAQEVIDYNRDIEGWDFVNGVSA